jgi:hypothetical protein
MKQEKRSELIRAVEQWCIDTMAEFANRCKDEKVIQLIQCQLAELQFVLARYEPKPKR